MPEDARRTERVIFPMSYYSENKAAIKKPFKELGLRWQYLGQDGETTRGRYSKGDVAVSVVYSSEHADFTIQGSDEEAIEAILEAWSGMEIVEPSDAGVPEGPVDEQLRKEVELWRFRKPARRPGEPDSFYERRLEAWEAQDPRA